MHIVGITICFALSLLHSNASKAGEPAQAYYAIQIASMPLKDSIQALSHTTDALVLFPYDLVDGLDSRPVNGSFTAHDALEVMLAGTELKASVTKKGVLMVSKKPDKPKNNPGDNKNMHTKKRFLATVMSFLAGGTAIAQTEGVALEEVVVTGIRGSLQKANDMKRFAASIQDSIVAEDLGKFPDQNVAESLQRISGVSIDRSNGEGAKITVRGFGPEFNIVKVNGRTIATTESSRDFNFQVLASELISGADVVKTPMAKTPSGSIGAYVDIKTARPLDNLGTRLAGSAKMKRNELSGEDKPEFSGLFSTTFAEDKWGVLVGLSKAESSNRIDSTSTSHWSTLPATAITGDIHNTRGEVVTPDEIRYPGRHQFGLAQEERERFGSNVTIQFAPNDQWVNTVDYLYTDFSNIAVSQGLQIPVQRAGWRDVVVSDNLTLVSATKFERDPSDPKDRGHPLDGSFNVRGMDAETHAYGFNSQFNGDRLSLALDYAISESEARIVSDGMVPNYINGDDGVNEFTYDTRGSDVLNFDTSIDFSDPDNARAHWNNVRDTILEDDVSEFRLDANYLFDVGVLSSVDAGILQSSRTKTRNVFRGPDGCKPNAIPWGSPEISLYNTCGAYRTIPGDVFSRSTVNDFLSDEAGNFPRNFIVVNDISAYHEGLASLRNDGTDDWPNKTLNETATVKTSEDITELFTQLNLGGQVNAITWSGNIGLRYTETETTSVGHGRERLTIEPVDDDSGEPKIRVTYTEPGEISRDKSYSNLLPSANFSLDFNNGFIARLAASKVVTRPSINDIGVNRSYTANHAAQFRTSGGNPSLQPYEAKQFDLSLEYYQENGNAYAINFFKKDLNSFISTIVTRDDTPDVYQNGSYVDTTVTIPGFGRLVEEITQKENIEGGTIQGYEIAALHQFSYLPGVLSGFGVQANYTYTESDSDVNSPLNLPGVKEPSASLEGFAKDSYNVIAFYDKYGFQFRAAYNWRNDFLKSRQSAGLPEHVDAYGQLDLRTSYDINDHITISADAINVTNERVFHYADVEERMRKIQYAGPRYSVGIRIKY